ncbi:thioredoxin family protein [Paracoccus sp. SCSIO 75233]|uniref:thioredoxin family protein n=1 Tax=Paracoccus sp. SCSIO 75233 TaxID=3017782 RepID=UPI0022F0654C|nr:thioredoxin family protein [Paracoccus sp. SCSIO 75233]WBU53480.1 thioredoxin family protein [Paracoccus sp. SCSIO 75233]
MRILIALIFAVFTMPAFASQLQLLVTYENGCGDFARWQREVAPGYARSQAGQNAPLLAVNMQGPWPDGLTLAQNPKQTPTFILLRNGQEVGRFAGYRSAAGFQSQLLQLLKRDSAGQ